MSTEVHHSVLPGLTTILCLGISACASGGAESPTDVDSTQVHRDAQRSDSSDLRFTPELLAEAGSDQILDDAAPMADVMADVIADSDGVSESMPEPDAEDDHSGPDGGNGCPNGVCPKVPRACTPACSTPADCVFDGAASGGIYDIDNWHCLDGKCSYAGCNSDAECNEQPGLEYAVHKCVLLSAGFKSCLATCKTASDCPLPARTTYSLYDEDNYECLSGVCSYSGCNNDAECMEALSSTGLNWKCLPTAWGFPSCVTECTQPDDCVYSVGSPLFDSDNYSCQNGICVHEGCVSDNECTEAYSYSDRNYVCSESY